MKRKGIVWKHSIIQDQTLNVELLMERAIKKTEKLIDTAEDDQEKNELEEKLRELKIDYNYVM
ncbi:14135_t:CDS:2, partial [Entrophospora sp. SA101]